MKQLSKKLQDFEHTLASKVVFDSVKVEMADYIKALKFGINKLDLIILTGIIHWLNDDQDVTYYPSGGNGNPLSIPSKDW